MPWITANNWRWCSDTLPNFLCFLFVWYNGLSRRTSQVSFITVNLDLILDRGSNSGPTLREVGALYLIAFSLYIFLGGLECVCHSFAYVTHFVFLRGVNIPTQRAAVASRCAANLATHLPPNWATHLTNQLSHPSHSDSYIHQPPTIATVTFRVPKSINFNV
jgi:hypothetical protein